MMMMRWRGILVLTALLSTTATTSAASGPFWKGIFGVRPSPPPPSTTNVDARGGAERENNNNVTTRIEEYVAAVEERDARDRQEEEESNNIIITEEKQQPQPKEDEEEWDSSSNSSNPSGGGGDEESSLSGSNSNPLEDGDGESVSVGVKAHKKSGSVGDADSDDDDDDDDDDDTDTDSDWEEFEDDLDHMMGTSTQLEVEVEFVEEDDHLHESDSSLSDQNLPKTLNSGGVGVILNQRTNRRGSNAARSSVSTATFAHSPVMESEMMEAWLPHVYLPPSKKAMDFLFDNARLIDGASKSRLDRRTLYACLLLEWLHGNATYRKFLEKTTSQALQAALSLATQPQWRKCSSQRLCGIRLYDSEAERGCTLAMQETIVMALAHSLGAGVVVLDDSILSMIRRDLLAKGYAEEDVKPAILIQWLLDVAREGKLVAGPGSVTGSLSRCMKEDLHDGLDDPFDERAVHSWQEMNEWETVWNDKPLDDEYHELPLVVFLRAESSKSLLKSKSAVELLLQEANSEEGINLLVIGKGLDANTEELPGENVSEFMETSPEAQPRGAPNGAPWFGFSPNNHNASGQNDPEGSRRFNIFLSRTMDPDGTQGILGAIAPPQAGNLFPHMMAMQAHERMKNQDDESPAKAELERWAQSFQRQQMNGGPPMPPPQFFNASFSGQFGGPDQPQIPPSPEIMQQTLQAAMSELLDRLAQMSEEEDNSDDPSNIHQAFAQVLRNEHLRRGITENLARAAPALADPKCQGVMLSVYVPPPPPHMNKGKMPNQKGSSKSPNMNGWFQRILNNQEESNNESQSDMSDEDREHSKQRRVRTMAAAAAMAAAKQAQASRDLTKETDKLDKYERNLARLESVCRPILVDSPSDPVRAKSWECWISRERGSVVFRSNRLALNEVLKKHAVTIQDHTGTQSAGSALRGMLSVRDIADDMDEVVQCAIEIEAQKSQRKHLTPDEIHESENDLEIDVSLSQLLVSADGSTSETSLDLRFLHPSSIESAINMVCKISPSPSGGLSVASSSPSHRTREEISALAQDKHERALVAQVVSPQDIGVTYDMIGGLAEVKELLRQSITYPLKFPHLYSEGIAREAVKGVLLFGPPGTGKTMLAKALASEGGASFLSVDASSIENKWLGESEKNAKAVFTLARRLAPCVIFIDEVDSLLSSREGTSDDSAHGTLTSVKTTMMSEWDGLNSGTNGVGEAGSDRVVVIGSTNRPFDLDEAVLRRFPRRILVDLPDLQTRKEILEVTLAENRLDPAVNLTSIAERLEGYTGSDIKEVCREAVVRISHEQAKLLDQGFADSREDQTKGSLQRLRPVTTEDFEDALSKLKRSVSEKGRELARVWEWNDEYGEMKKDKKNQLPQLANMYL